LSLVKERSLDKSVLAKSRLINRSRLRSKKKNARRKRSVSKGSRILAKALKFPKERRQRKRS